MRFDYSLLLLKIQEVYDSTSVFAKDLGISLKSLDNRLFNVTQWKSCEIAKACDLLKIPVKDADLYFFTALN